MDRMEYRRPPWERRKGLPVHPIGRARRRWPRAYDGGDPDEGAVQDRYQRTLEPDHPAHSTTRRRSSLEVLRQSPVRNGLIGLAVAGTAAPIAINRYQQAMRTDPAHENIMASVAAAEADDDGVKDVWEELEEAENSAEQQREDVVQESVEKFSEYGLEADLAEVIYDAALEHEIDPDIAFGLIRAESSFRNTSTSPVGAVGLTQLMPKTASWLQPGVTRAELREPATNVRIGFKYLRQLIDKYEGDTKLALTAYNRGPGTVDRELRRGGNPDNGYADFVEGKENHGHSLYTR